MIAILSLLVLSSLIAGSGLLNRSFSYYLCIAATFCAAIGIAHIYVSQITYSLEQSWFSAGGIEPKWHFYLGDMEAKMALVVCSVSLLVQFYSIEYMQKEPNAHLFFAYLVAFTASMLLLVASGNLFQMFIGWELISLFSYLMIGFWVQGVKAASKVFMVGRAGDIALLLAILICSSHCCCLDFSVVMSCRNELKNLALVGPFSVLDALCLLLLAAAMTKSAQFIFYKWLIDAMAAPTPASAFIHAASMVAAGVFLVCKMQGLFILSDAANMTMILLGMFHAIFASYLAIFARNIKEVLALSTSAQLGYMFFACGIKAYEESCALLMCHAFYKASLFLLIGNVISLTNRKTVVKIGNAAYRSDFIFLLFICSACCLLGLPPWPGFYIKEAILAHNHWLLVYLGNLFITSLTGIYCGRLFKCLLGKGEGKAEVSISVTYPVALLIIGAMCFSCAAEIGSSEDLVLPAFSLLGVYIGYAFSDWINQHYATVDYPQFKPNKRLFELLILVENRFKKASFSCYKRLAVKLSQFDKRLFDLGVGAFFASMACSLNGAIKLCDRSKVFYYGVNPILCFLIFFTLL